MSFLTTPAGVRLRYTDRGSGSHTIVLVHGWKGSHRPLKLTRTLEFPWTMSDEQLRGYLEDLAANWPDAERTFSRGALRDPSSAYADLYYQVALQTPLEMATRIVEEQIRLDHIPVLPTLGIPVLALYGRHDPYYPVALAEYIAEHTPNGSHVIFEDSAHAPHYEEPDRFCEVIGAFARTSG